MRHRPTEGRLLCACLAASAPAAPAPPPQSAVPPAASLPPPPAEPYYARICGAPFPSAALGQAEGGTAPSTLPPRNSYCDWIVGSPLSSSLVFPLALGRNAFRGKRRGSSTTRQLFDTSPAPISLPLDPPFPFSLCAWRFSSPSLGSPALLRAGALCRDVRAWTNALSGTLAQAHELGELAASASAPWVLSEGIMRP